MSFRPIWTLTLALVFLAGPVAAVPCRDDACQTKQTKQKNDREPSQSFRILPSQAGSWPVGPWQVHFGDRPPGLSRKGELPPGLRGRLDGHPLQRSDAVATPPEMPRQHLVPMRNPGSAVTPIPEPTALVLFGSAFTLMLAGTAVSRSRN